ncbi:MAG: acetyl-CoA carboxylase biotin carboxylase subunit [Vampirovibrionales bacterium]
MSSKSTTHPQSKTNANFKKVLVANRGEIALRIIRGVQQAGLKAVAIYSSADQQSPHRFEADEAYEITGETAGETYLNIDRVLAIASQSKSEAIHPGYGFLSENAIFAKRCQEAGLIFIGPEPRVIEAMGDKITAKHAMQNAQVPVLPGITLDDDLSIEIIAEEAEKIGYPVLVKAAAGGGGKGMRLVSKADDLANAIESARREATKAFGDGRVFLEKYIEKPRHVEIQVIGDTHGNLVHLFERECSIQRRHQKILEESPSIALSTSLRKAMGEAAIAAAKTIGYTNAGTVEFIVAPDGRFYFLEVNTRLQVEHPVTELVTGIDLVQWQLQVAQGEKLSKSQNQLSQRGHAIECRIYAEDPNNQFLPATGTLYWVQWPQGPNIRIDAGVTTGNEIGIHYDPMLAKLIVWGETRPLAIETLRKALQETIILGVTTNIPFLLELIQHPEFVNGNTHTHFLNEHSITLQQEPTNALWAASAFAQIPNSPLQHLFQGKNKHSKTLTNFSIQELALNQASSFRHSGLVGTHTS